MEEDVEEVSEDMDHLRARTTMVGVGQNHSTKSPTDFIECKSVRQMLYAGESAARDSSVPLIYRRRSKPRIGGQAIMTG